MSGLDGVFVLNRMKILIVASLIATWSIAHLLPTWSPIVHDTVSAQLAKYRERIPSVKIDFHPNKDPRTAYNASKLAMIIEPRAIPHLVPQILHMISVVPPDWRFLFIGTNLSVTGVGRSYGMQYQQKIGKLDLMVVPDPWSIDEKEDVWRMLTDKDFYDELLPGVEWLLKFESDSILCSNAEDSVDDWLGYDWVTSPRSEDDRFAGNGGLSIRRVSVMKRILSYQSRYPGSEPEDEWFGVRVSHTPGLKIATAEEENHFAVEDVYHEKPMGYHLHRGSEKLPENVWKNKDQRKKIFEYCPEISMIMDMKLEIERCEGDNREGELVEVPPKEEEDTEEKRSIVVGESSI